MRLASALRQMADVLLLLPRQLAGPYLSVLDPQVNLQPFDKPRLRQGGRQIRVGFDLLRQLKSFDPDVIHLQQGHLWFNGFLPLLRRYPLVLTVHDPRQHLGDDGGRKTPQAIMDFGFRRASQLIVHAKQSKQVVVGECGDSTGDRPRCASHQSGYQPPGATARQWVHDLVLRPDLGVQGARVSDSCRAAHHRGGPGREDRDCRAGRGLLPLPAHDGPSAIASRFTTSIVPDEGCNKLFQQASVVVLPYVEASQSGVIPLAYTFMKPVVATTVGGLPEMVEDGRTGYLVPPRDERALAAAVAPGVAKQAARSSIGAQRQAQARRRMRSARDRPANFRCLQSCARPTIQPQHTSTEHGRCAASPACSRPSDPQFQRRDPSS